MTIDHTLDFDRAAVVLQSAKFTHSDKLKAQKELEEGDPGDTEIIDVGAITSQAKI